LLVCGVGYFHLPHARFAHRWDALPIYTHLGLRAGARTPPVTTPPPRCYYRLHRLSTLPARGLRHCKRSPHHFLLYSIRHYRIPWFGSHSNAGTWTFATPLWLSRLPPPALHYTACRTIRCRFRCARLFQLQSSLQHHARNATAYLRRVAVYARTFPRWLLPGCNACRTAARFWFPDIPVPAFLLVRYVSACSGSRVCFLDAPQLAACKRDGFWRCGHTL